MFDEMEASGSKIPMMCKQLFANGWVVFEHHDNWIKVDWLKDFRKFNGVDTSVAYDIMMNEQGK